MKNFRPYERVLKRVKSHGDIWMTSQGEYVAWWQRRHRASLKITVFDGESIISSDLEDAVFERFPQEFLASKKASCKDSSFSGELQLVIDVTLERKHLLIDALQREGIMNFTVGEEGKFFLSHELDGVLERMEGHLRRKELKDYNQTILCIRDTVAAMLAKHGLPLIRIWYHPWIGGKVIKAVFSPCHDVDRAITNMPKILRLEQKYNASSSVHVRVFHPFYKDEEILKLDSLPHSAEIALHAEFARHTQQYGSKLVAAKADKAHLERIIGRPVAGVSIHGGELIYGYRQNVWETIERCKFLYSTPHGSSYYFPYQRLNEESQLETTYYLCCQFRDIDLPYDNYAAAFYEEATRSLEKVLEHNGVFVLVLHAEYFGVFSYLRNPKNFVRLVRYIPTYLIRVWKLKKNQMTLKVLD